MSWSTGWISQGVALAPRSSTRARRSPTVSNLTLRSLQMTSGLFNTGGAGDSMMQEVTSLNTTVTAQPGSSSMADKMATTSSSASAEAVMFACGGQDDSDSLADAFDTHFDMEMLGDLAGGGGGLTFDPLDDASLDSFTDLTAYLSEENMLFMDSMQTDDSELPAFTDIGNDISNVKTTSLKRSFDQMAEVEKEAEATDNGVATTTIASTSNLDHDYSSKRPKLSTPTIVIAEQSTAVEEVFIAPPAPLTHPTPSTSSSLAPPAHHHHPATPSTPYIITLPREDTKSRKRREKNNVASKRSRETRKLKFKNMEEEADHLIVENTRLEKRIGEMERLAKQMKEILVAKMAGK